MVNESSGIVKSKKYKNTYWTHNDSGDAARIFAITQSGNLIQPKWYKGKYQGIHIVDAHNIDWEDIAMDQSGNLFIGAFGNNGNARRDLAIYELSEPNPMQIIKARSSYKYRFTYPDQKEYPPKKRNFDAEGFFEYKNDFYIFSKNRADKKTKAYVLKKPDPLHNNVLELLGEFDCKGLITAADISDDQQVFTIMSYNNLHVFELKPQDPFSKLLITLNFGFTKQIEGICFDENKLLISNENKKLYLVDWKQYLNNQD